MLSQRHCLFSGICGAFGGFYEKRCILGIVSMCTVGT